MRFFKNVRGEIRTFLNELNETNEEKENSNIDIRDHISGLRSDMTKKMLKLEEDTRLNFRRLADETVNQLRRLTPTGRTVLITNFYTAVLKI